ncbi:phosphatidylglycerol lysyltransferase domain-containing protein [Ruminococcus sp. CLA-AA-H200]|uniref:Phosphatidylglycerol lysyltransferase domain-containing protein n=1 Tax=Ruminococcus turbiniformis TaxID=2881258 RepID=A0ABS8FUW9_9FIRM|nr:phosphatidylglycerol lysyltransferase domain-containing protein [Ruminococcus turbiniformis]MCC2253786.1 phosphatidylglycerol lysyltransferase domain-containing protein [Ruminococcus turbiniformis]
MTEPDFKRPELEDRDLISSYFKQAPSRSCERSFVNCYLWSRHYNVKFAVIEDSLVFRNESGGCAYSYPAGKPENVRRALEWLMEYCREKNCPFALYNVTPEMFDQLEKWYPGRFSIEYNRDYADYVYETEKLATLAGKKLHGKRNHINKFMKLYPDWSYETLSDDNVEECFQMALQWRNDNGCEDDPEKNAEMCVALNSLRLYKELGMTGGVLRVNGKIAAFTVGEPLCDDTFVVHIEKAYADVEGAYPMINQQFVQHECMNYKYVNREDDTGAEGLRKAKLSYRPAFLEEKGFVKETE